MGYALHAIFPSVERQAEIRCVEALGRVEKAPKANVVFLSEVHRLTITKDEVNVKGNDTSTRSTASGHVWVER